MSTAVLVSPSTSHSRIETTRSPNYPNITLQQAIARAEVVFKHFKRHPTGKEQLGEKWEMSPKSSTLRLTLAALRAYGLLEEAPAKGEPMHKLSELALDIIADLPAGDPRRARAIQQAALSPRVHAELFDEWGGSDLPDDSEIRRYLVRTLKFNDNTVDTFIRSFRSTLEFAGLLGSGRMTAAPGSTPARFEAARISVGDLVQWTSQGVNQFLEPKRVVGLTDDDNFVYVEGSMAGLPTEQLSIAEPRTAPLGGASLPAAPTAPPISPLPPGYMEDVSTLPEGRVIIRIPSQLSSFSYEILEDFLKQLLRKAKHSVDDGDDVARPNKTSRK